MLGDLAALGAAASWAFGTVLVKGPTSRFSALYISAFRAVIAAVLVLVIAAGMGELRGIAQIPGWAIGFLLGGSLIVLVGDLTFVRAIALDDMSRVFPITTGLFILSSVAASALVAHEPVTWFTLAGGLLMIVSVSLIATARRTQGKEQQEVNAVPRRHIPALILSVVTALLWTVSLLILDRAMVATMPLPAVALRMPFMVLVLLAMTWARGDAKRYRRIGSRDMIVLVLSGALVGLSGILFTAAIKWSTAGNVSILGSTSPLFVVPVAYFVLKEPMTKGLLLGTAMCMLGIWLTML